MRLLACRALFMSLMLGAMLSQATAQSVQKQGVITGRVTFGEKAMPNVPVALFAIEHSRTAIAKATTDYEGRYRLTGVPAGRYSIVVIAPAFVWPSEGSYGDVGKFVTVMEGETVEKMDFPLVRGGVITGRVTDADGAPVIGERVQLNPVGQAGGGGSGFSNFNPFMYETDDRGIYRLYGISPGKYTVSVGETAENGDVRFGFGGRGYYARTFHPDVTEQAKATVIEIAEGTEASNVNITLGRKAKSFVAWGRVVDEKGQPLANTAIGHGAVLKEGNRLGGFGRGALSDAQGRFRLDGLMPGRYAAFVWPEGSTTGYSDPVIFEITDADITGLELKLRRGSTLSGVAVIEGTSDPTILAKLSQLSIGLDVEAEGIVAPHFSSIKIAPDGSFHVAGLHPGKTRIYLATYPPPKGFSLARIERDGVAQPTIEIAPGAQVSNVRVVFEYGTGIIRGLVKLENGPAPDGTRIIVSVYRKGDANGMIRYGALVDSRGRFLVEGVPNGEYELLLQTYLNGATQRRLPPIKQSVMVTSGVETEVNFTVDLKTKPLEEGNNE